MTESTTNKLTNAFDYFLLITVESDEIKRDIQAVVKVLDKEKDGTTIRYSLSSNISPDLPFSKLLAGNRIFLANLVISRI